MAARDTYIVAVSGGVDSVVLLDMLVKQAEHKLIVAHFDHGIRDDSASDGAFVGELASSYGLASETKREELGKGASEELARTQRYAFLRAVAEKHHGTLVTAHHANDVVETIAINLTRGTGWRGLAVLDSDVVRPLLTMTKQEILRYADEHQLQWHEDSTNSSDAYLRNRIRRKASTMNDDEVWQLQALRVGQVELKHLIDQELARLIGDGPDYSRYFFSHLDTITGRECLRRITQGRLTRPQCDRVLLAIKTAKPGHQFEAGSGLIFRFTSRYFSCELVKWKE